jgi:uncharacterized OsmC-like protein
MSDSNRLHTFSVEATGEHPTRTTVTTRGFEFVVDEPAALGGDDAGPNPVEYLLGALAGCLNVVGHLVADEMGFDLDGIEFRIEGDLDPAAFQGADTDARAGYQDVRVELVPETDADEATLDEWLSQVEARCPVSDNVGAATPMSLSVVRSN